MDRRKFVQTTGLVGVSLAASRAAAVWRVRGVEPSPYTRSDDSAVEGEARSYGVGWVKDSDTWQEAARQEPHRHGPILRAESIQPDSGLAGKAVQVNARRLVLSGWKQGQGGVFTFKISSLRQVAVRNNCEMTPTELEFSRHFEVDPQHTAAQWGATRVICRQAPMGDSFVFSVNLVPLDGDQLSRLNQVISFIDRLKTLGISAGLSLGSPYVPLAVEIAKEIKNTFFKDRRSQWHEEERALSTVPAGMRLRKGIYVIAEGVVDWQNAFYIDDHLYSPDPYEKFVKEYDYWKGHGGRPPALPAQGLYYRYFIFEIAADTLPA